MQSCTEYKREISVSSSNNGLNFNHHSRSAVLAVYFVSGHSWIVDEFVAHTHTHTHTHTKRVEWESISLVLRSIYISIELLDEQEMALLKNYIHFIRSCSLHTP